MGRYITSKAVKIRLKGKVRFTDNPEEADDEAKMTDVLLNRLISEAESQVELDLSERYAAPFRTDNDEGFSKLPQLTRDQIMTLCELQSVVRVLETNFGATGPVDSDKYKSSQEKRYEKMIEILLERRKGEKQSWNIFKKPPLPCLKLNYMNAAADTGFAGRIHSDSVFNDGAYPAQQINNPAKTFFSPFGTGGESDG